MALLCMFCGLEIAPDQLTMEHPVPKGLWEKGRRPRCMRTLPAPQSCNQSFSADNEYFRDVMVMEDGARRHPEARRVQTGAIARKFKTRFGSIVKTLKNVAERRMRTPSGIDLGRHPAFEVEWPRIERVLCNVMKGVFYISQKYPMPQNFIIAVSATGGVRREWLERTVKFMCPWQSFGDSVFCCRYARSSRDPIKKFTCLMQFYEHRLFVGEAIDPEVFGDGGDLFVPAGPDSMVLVPRWAAEH